MGGQGGQLFTQVNQLTYLKQKQLYGIYYVGFFSHFFLLIKIKALYIGKLSLPADVIQFS